MKNLNMILKVRYLTISITIILWSMLFFGSTILAQTNEYSLSGEWYVELVDSVDQDFRGARIHRSEGFIHLPGSLAQNRYGVKTIGSDFGILTPEFKYIGRARYTREIEIPLSWKNKEVEIFLERVLWESRIFIDGEKLSRQDALGTPHIHRIGKLAPGIHQLTIVVNNDMIHNIGDKGHAYSDYTQSIWNGIVGKMEMRSYDPVHIRSVRTFPDVSADRLKVEVCMNEIPEEKSEFSFSIIPVEGEKIVLSKKYSLKDFGKDKCVVFDIPVRRRLEKWSEFNPKVYSLEIVYHSKSSEDIHRTEFGFCEVSHNGTRVLVNGEPVFLRGNLDCVHFPLTGYPSTDLEDWKKIFRIYKQYGLNHVRFHSWCPPEAAFKAANRLGIYIQAEASIWIDWWMSTDMTERGRPEMDTKGHPQGLGYDSQRDSFVVREMNRVVDHYGNHPSFVMFCIGNELGNADFDAMGEWITNLKTKDPRRLYAASTARKINDSDDYSATHFLQGIGSTRGLRGARTDWDFEDVYNKVDIPVIAHEIGQWPVYPRWIEIDKYTGVLKARNFEEFKTVAEKNGIVHQDIDFSKASGALNQILYKYEIESFLRTRSCAGVQLLSMQDYQGQGEALIGWLDAHWESKEITTPDHFRMHYNTVVPLLRMEKFVWTNREIFKAKAQLTNYGRSFLKAKCRWEIVDEERNVYATGSFKKEKFSRGSLTDLGEIAMDLRDIDEAKQLSVIISVPGTEFINRWDFWVFPDHPEQVELPQDISIEKNLSAEVVEKLINGGSVLLDAHEIESGEWSVHAGFYPLYWSLTFFPGQGKTNIGLLLQEKHPAFSLFPTSFHSDWQWESVSKDAKGFILNDLPKNYLPIAQPIDDFHRNNKVGSVFELKVGKGRLLVCGYNLESGLPASNQLKRSLVEYMKSPQFQPEQAVAKDWLLKILPDVPQIEKAEGPEELSGAILNVKAGDKLKELNQKMEWQALSDEVGLQKDVRYQLVRGEVLKNESVSGWIGESLELQIDCPHGFLGTLYVNFQDRDNKNRSGILEFEGRKTRLGDHGDEGLWVKFHIMREDSNDGKLVLKASVNTGPDLMIKEILLIKE